MAEVNTLRVSEAVDGARVDVLVVTKASKARVGPVVDGRLKIAVTAPAVEGKANTAVVVLMAELFALRRSDVTITAGTRSRRKTVQLLGIARASAVRIVASMLLHASGARPEPDSPTH